MSSIRHRLLGLASGIIAGLGFISAAAAAEPVKVGILHSLTGTMEAYSVVPGSSPADGSAEFEVCAPSWRNPLAVLRWRGCRLIVGEALRGFFRSMMSQ